mmetsp:Transcript_16096/g.62544  ORF Transcript_16096/g.62544 Transcript_16096/m.62544 type:complete len:221 (+) Transcript_16096:354-1016(+)
MASRRAETSVCPQPHRVFRAMKSALISRHASSSHPTQTSIPAASSVRIPPPLTRGSGSTNPTTTRLTPASTSALEHGGVRPKWSHGSSVTYAVHPFALAPAALSAKTSACGSPAFGWYPSPTTTPSSSTMTQPTTGLGKVFPAAVAASARARRIRSASASVYSASDDDARMMMMIDVSRWDAGDGIERVVRGRGVRSEISCGIRAWPRGSGRCVPNVAQR